MAGNHADASDLAQNALVTAYKKLGQYKPEYSFCNWVISICSNQSKNLFRSRARRRAVEQKHCEEREKQSAQHHDRTHSTEIEEALRKLPGKLQIAVTLKHIEGFSHEEIAETLHISMSAAKMRVKRGIEQLYILMAPENGGQ